eukprot:scaffold315253_cov31-Tisochrysis_lutea.AAC.2
MNGRYDASSSDILTLRPYPRRLNGIVVAAQIFVRSSKGAKLENTDDRSLFDMRLGGWGPTFL